MTNSSDILFSKLAGFARALRNQGMQVGLGELIDAVRALELTGFMDRETVRLALRALLAKSRREMLLFDQCFDAYFVSEEEFQKNAQAEAQAEALAEEQRRMADEELRFNGKPIDLREDLREVYGKMPQEERDKLQRYIERYSDNLKRRRASTRASSARCSCAVCWSSRCFWRTRARAEWARTATPICSAGTSPTSARRKFPRPISSSIR